MNEGIVFAAFDVTATVFWVVRIAATICGALVGWFATSPLARLIYRGAFHRPIPTWLLPWTRLAGAALVGLLIFYFLPLGGFGSLGWGPGAGGAPGLGAGSGSGKKEDGLKDDDGKNGSAQTSRMGSETLDIELIGGTRYRGDGRFYLMQGKEPVLNLEEVDDYFKKNKDRLAEYVTIVLTPDSVAPQHGAVLRLNTIIEKYERIPQVKNVNKALKSDQPGS